MAERRMFAKSIIDTDAFLGMPLSAQALYFHLCMRADDDGFVSNPRKIQRMISCADDDLKLLMAKRYILVFDSGVIVIKHWRIHNYIRKDMYHKTLYAEEKSLIYEKTDGAYTDHPVTVPLQERHEPVTNPSTQVRLGKVRLGKDRLDKSTGNPPHRSAAFLPPSLEDVASYCAERQNRIDPERFIDFYAAKGWMVGKNKMKDWKACIRTWEKRDENAGRSANGNTESRSSQRAPEIPKYGKVL